MSSLMPYRFSLHAAREPKSCQGCGVTVPVGGEFWRVKGGDRGIPRLLCCLCHVLYGLPTDGWTVAPDGRSVMSAAVAIGADA